MYKSLLLIVTAFIFNLIPSICNGQHTRQISFPEPPSIQVVEEQLFAWNAFKANYPDWRVRWDSDTGGVRYIYGSPINYRISNPVMVARQFVSENRNMLKVKETNYDIRICNIYKLHGIHIRFQQYYNNIPVEGGILSAHMNSMNSVYMINNHCYDNIVVKMTIPTYDINYAINAVLSELCVELERCNIYEEQLIILPYGADFLLAWKIGIAVSDPYSNIVALPKELTLDQNYPNPFNPTTTVRYGLPISSRVNLRIMNIRGQTVRTLVDEEKQAGWYTVTWDGKNESGQDVSSGVYLYLLETNEGSILKKMTLIR